ncbi:MAG: hypothetical protein EOM66_07320 [Clostridia bacterium]|nr:hypothetical protein [Clostridia bacterium]
MDISKAVLSIHSAVVGNKVYDGTTAAVISDVVLNGLIPGESLEAGVDYTVSGLFGNANAGNDIPVTVSVTPTTTEKAANYAVSGTGSFMANITKKALVISGVSATNRAYDGTSAVVLAGGALGGVAATDTGSVSFSLGVGAMADAKAGSGKPVSTNIVLTGAKAANYSLTQPAGITVDISKAALSIHGADIANKVYNGTTAATVSNLTFSGLASGESLEAGVDYTVSSLFDSANAGNNIPVTVSVTLATTEKATNYAVSGTGSFMADITPRGLTGGVVVDVDNTTGQAALVDEGDMLRANTSGVSVPGTLTVSYQWYRNGATIAGATLASYTVGNLSADPAGTSFTVKVTGTGNYMGTLESAAKVVSQLPLAGSISITGSTAVGNTLSLDASLLTPAAATYDIIWMRGDVPIGGATGVDYTIVREDVGKTLSVVITATGNYTGTKRASLRISAGGISGSSPYVPAYAILNQTGRATVDLTAGSTLVSAEQFSQLMALNADKPVVMRGRGYNITFPQGSMRSIGGYSGDLNFGISFNMGAHYAAIKSAAGDDFILMLQFIHSGPLPGTAQVSIYVGTQYAGQSLQYLYYNPQAGKLEPMQTATVDTNGYITVTQDHCSSYAVTFYGPIDIPKTGDSEPGIWGWLIAGISAWGMIAILTSWGPKRKHPGRTF